MLVTIEKEIHRSPNWARYEMNIALISIGVFKPALRKEAVAAAKRIGRGGRESRRDLLQDA